MKDRRWGTSNSFDNTLTTEVTEERQAKAKQRQNKSRNDSRSKGKWLGVVLSAAMVLQAPLLPTGVHAAEGTKANSSSSVTIQNVQPTIQLLSEEPITAGATLRKYQFTTTRNNVQVSTNVHMIVVDLNQPYVKLDVMTGVNGNIATQQTVRNMAKETGAVAGTNGDFFHMGKSLPPIGPVIDDGVWLTTPLNSQGWYTFGVSKDNKAVIDYYDFRGTITAPNGMSFPLSGINRAAAYHNGQHTHIDKVFMYTPEWTLDRANDGNTQPSEIYVQDGIVVDMVFNETLPLESVPEGGVILRANRQAANFFKQNFQIGDPIVIDYDLKPQDPENKVHGQDLSMLIGGHTLLINEGKAASYTVNTSTVSGVHSRTGVGISRDGRYVYLLAADKAGASQGMSLKDMQDFMIMAGIWKGMNLDGGGSTTMVSRPLGNTEVALTNAIQNGASERRVANGIGVYTTAPKGEVLGFTIQGPKQVFLKDKAAYGLKAYDTYYNPLSTSDVSVQWGVNGARGSFEDHYFVPSQIGKTTISARSGSIYEEFEVEVVGRDHLESLQINAPNLVLVQGQTYQIPVIATTKDGHKKELSSESLKWEFIGFEGTVENNELTVEKVTDESVGYIIASYDGFSTMLTVPVGSETLWADFDTLTHEVSFMGTPEPVQGWAHILSGLPGKADNDHVLHIKYDFLDAEDVKTKAAYASFNNDAGVIVPGKPTQMSLELMGDNSMNWVRAEIVDNDGKTHRVDLSRDIDWYGFKDIAVDLTSYQMSYPITLKRIYVASPEEQQEVREQGGAIAVDNISFYYQGQLPEAEKVKVELTIDKKELLAGDRKLQLDQAPVIKNRTTLIPVYFIEEALGGIVRWDNDERKVTLIKDGNIVELWIDNPNVIVNGARVTSPAAPVIMSQRTMVPLRIISEAFGWNVTWEGDTRTVVLE